MSVVSISVNKISVMATGSLDFLFSYIHNKNAFLGYTE